MTLTSNIFVSDRSPGWVAFLIIFMVYLCSCEGKPVHGSLRVNAPTDGTYEIYRVSSEKPLQLVSEHVGRFNTDHPLVPGSYLVLADCSDEAIVIYPHQTVTLTAHQINFIPPIDTNNESNFSIHCNRSEKTRSRQHIVDRYSLNLLSGKRQLLVGMVPLHIDFLKLKDVKHPKKLSYKLSGVQVSSKKKIEESIPYFVSPADDRIAITYPQDFGKWLFLLSGKYIIEVNGTIMHVTLEEGELREIEPAYFRATTPDEADLALSSQVTGSPQLVEINSGHWLNFNETYPLLPGKAFARLGGSTRKAGLELVEGELIELKVRSVHVDLGCSPWEWTCLGSRGISLYLNEKPYPFIESVTDIPILFFDDEAPVWLGVEGSRDIRYRLKRKSNQKLNVGIVRLKPRPGHRPGQVTDLMRVEAKVLPYAGYTLDVSLEKLTKMPLISGVYYLANYVTLTGLEGERRRTRRSFSVRASRTKDLEFKVYMPEKKYLAAIEKLQNEKQRKKRKSSRSKHEFSRPLRYY